MARKVYKFGSNPLINLGGVEDIIAAGGDQYWPTANATTTLVSTSVEDAVGGDGLEEIEVIGIVITNGRFLEVKELVVPTGQSLVTLENEFYRVYRGWGGDVGVDGVNAGAIAIKHGANVLAQINAGDGQTLQATYTIPEFEKQGMFLTGWNVSITKGGNASSVEASLQIRSAPGQSWRTIDRGGTSSLGAPYKEDWGKGLIYLPPGYDVRARVTDCTANATAVHGGIHFAA